MNQILITKKLYVTPELKRKKKAYKIEFFLSVFLFLTLTSVYIYAEYDRNKSEEVSQEILANINEKDTTVADNDVLLVILDDIAKPEIQTTLNGYRYTTIATINIPKLGITYPVLDGETDSLEETEALLKIAPIKFWGANPNEVGNFCIIGHNYRNSKFFSKVPTLVNGDIIEITNLSTGNTMSYSVYDKFEVDPKDTSCTSQHTNGQKEITLITCTNDSTRRVIVKARKI